MTNVKEDHHSLDSDLRRDDYNGAIVVILIATTFATVAAIIAGILLVSPVLLAVAVTLWISAGLLLSMVIIEKKSAEPEADAPAQRDETDEVLPAAEAEPQRPIRKQIPRALRGLQDMKRSRIVREGVVFTGLVALGILLFLNVTPYSLSFAVAGSAAAACLIAAALAASAAQYLNGLDPIVLPEARGLGRLTRVVIWILVLAALSMLLAWVWPRKISRVPYFLISAFNAILCVQIQIAERKTKIATLESFDFSVLSILGSRTNMIASILDSAERQLGIDLRSTWALTVIRSSLEPIVIALVLLGWLSTSLSVLGVQEQGLIERFGVPVAGNPMMPGLHAHWPWPVDRMIRFPVQKVQSITVGHEAEQSSGPEDVIWAIEHAPNEYTLLLGNGRDLITVDAAVQFRIRDIRAWRYRCRNPIDALHAIAYRAVMRCTVSKTLSEALSENVVQLTGRMSAMVQQDADGLGLGVEIVAFTIGGMHPPVAVAPAYQAVVSAELGKTTAMVNAQALRNQIVPQAQADSLTNLNAAHAAAAESRARAVGEAWSFEILESQYKISPEEYFFRRRLESLERRLGDRGYTIVDSRIQRDGGEIWLMQ